MNLYTYRMCYILQLLPGYPAIPIEVVELEDPLELVLLCPLQQQCQCQNKILKIICALLAWIAMDCHLKCDDSTARDIHQGEYVMRVGTYGA